MPGNAPKSMPEHRRGALMPQRRPSGSPFGSFVFALRFVEAVS